VRFAEVMKLMGASVEYEPNAIKLTGPSRPLKSFDHNCNDIPDAAMTAAVAALLADGCASTNARQHKFLPKPPACNFSPHIVVHRLENIWNGCS
jgi:5-enolpyruvylshikimate-3-phosphate synthase